jgi:tRNA A-37 threonylcarbamoyl transferase component Bud32
LLSGQLRHGDGLSQKATNENSGFHKQILDFCKHIAGSSVITSVCRSDDYAIEAPTAKSTVEILIALKDFQPRLLSYVRVLDGRNVVFLAVDDWIFERDVDRGFLGEALANMLLFPYTALLNEAYLQKQEVALKRRLILELMENLVLSYPELSYQIRVKPEYFMYEVMVSRVRVFPPMAYGTANFLCGEANSAKVGSVLQGYLEALVQLQKGRVINFADNYVVLSDAFISASKNPAVRFTNTIKNAPRALFTSLFSVFPQLLNFISQNNEALFRFQTPPWKREFDFSHSFVDPQKYVFVPTAEGLVSLADKMDIRSYAKRVFKNSDSSKIKVEEVGGVLNDVYLIKAQTDYGEQKVLVKRFKDLSSMKWFPLSMWSVGARTFALLGRSRLERECAINEVLREAGFRVPKLLHISASERLVFMEFVEGKNLGHTIKQIVLSPSVDQVSEELALVKKVGETYAKAHALKVALGDTKPENTIVTPDGSLCLLDFEQGSRNGDAAWDVACFLYYCGHYMPRNGEDKAEAIARAFIDGYFGAGGETKAVKCAADTRYTRVFSIFTLPTILRAMANVCKNVEGKGVNRD